MGVRAIVRNGRLLVDEETPLPDGTVLDLVIDDEGDDLDAPERAALTAALDTSLDEARQGLVDPVADVMARLRTRRRG